MTTEIIDKTVKETIYVAEDGAKFYDIKDCEDYEAKINEDNRTDTDKRRLRFTADDNYRIHNERPIKLCKVISSEEVNRDVCEVVYNEVLGCVCPSCNSILYLGKNLKVRHKKKLFCFNCGARLVVVRRVLKEGTFDKF